MKRRQTSPAFRAGDSTKIDDAGDGNEDEIVRRISRENSRKLTVTPIAERAPSPKGSRYAEIEWRRSFTTNTGNRRRSSGVPGRDNDDAVIIAIKIYALPATGNEIRLGDGDVPNVIMYRFPRVYWGMETLVNCTLIFKIVYRYF